MTPLMQATALWLTTTGMAATAAMHYYRTSARQARKINTLRARADKAEDDVTLRDQEARHLLETRLPAVVRTMLQGHGGVEDPGLLHARLADTEPARSYRLALERVATLTEHATAQAEGATRSTVLAVARSFQALVNEQQTTITEMLDSLHDEKVLEYAQPIDHACSQLQRRAQVIGLLAGSWPGRQRKDAPLLDVVRGGVSRIRDYRRIHITGERAEHLYGRFVEPVVLAVAELLDNAARHSEPGTTVEVHFVEAHNGISIIIDDAGIGLTPEDRATAARLLSGGVPVKLTELRNPPKFGFVAVGVLAEKYGFKASVEHVSVHDGVRAVLHLPRALLSATAPSPSMSSPPPTHPDGPSLPPEAVAQQERYPVAEDGLPVRRRGASPQRSTQRPAATRPPAGSGSQLAAFLRGTESAGHTSPDQESS